MVSSAAAVRLRSAAPVLELVPVPVAAVGLALWCLSRLPRYRDFNIEMARRMAEDMVFDHGDALRDFGYRPRSFEPVVERPA